MTMPELPEVAEVRVLRPRPGDVIVVSTDDVLSIRAAEQIMANLQAVFGVDAKVIVLDSGAHLSVVRADEVTS